MSTIQEQLTDQKNQLLDELAEISPYWAHKIQKQDLEFETKDEKVYDLSKKHRCVVGEAYGFTTRYGCKTCDNLSCSIYRSSKEDAVLYNDVIKLRVTRAFNRELRKFVNHFKEAHEK